VVKPRLTSICKEPVRARIALRTLNLDGVSLLCLSLTSFRYFLQTNTDFEAPGNAPRAIPNSLDVSDIWGRLLYFETNRHQTPR
jgi:hypothetical protein